MSKHTPGPWFTSQPNEGGGTLIKPIPGQVIAQCDLMPEMEANAHLVAAAPELLYALESIVEMNPELPMGMIEAADDAIAKARGEV